MSDTPKQWEGFSFWPSFADIITVMVLILLFLLFAQITMNSQALVAGEVLRRQEEISKEVIAALGNDKGFLTIVSDGNLQRLQFSDRVLFNSGEAELLPKGRELLRLVGDVLYRKASLLTTLQVEGHTDVRQIHTVKFGSNWELSSARATSVVRFLQGEIGFDPRILSATGYAEFRPIALGNADDALSRNRRVELVLIYSTKEIMQGTPAPLTDSADPQRTDADRRIMRTERPVRAIDSRPERVKADPGVMQGKTAASVSESVDPARTETDPRLMQEKTPPPPAGSAGPE